ncbi:MAG: ABC transporter permease [Lachnospiraceae bacterium]|nr:ABC transporter permease [Lachnospiraceae bacterium]
MMHRRAELLIYCIKKVLSFVISIVFLSLVVFYISRWAPGDPLVSYYGERVEKMSPEEREWAEERLGLNDLVYVQYIRWAQNALHGSFGISYKYKTDVTEVIGGRIGNTLLLGGIGFLLIFLLAPVVGILCVWYENKLPDKMISRVGTISSCIPEFWFSLVLILVFSVIFKILPGSGAYDIGKSNDVLSRIRHLILPLAVVVISHIWYYAYMVRNKLLEEVRADYVLLAKAKGLSRSRILLGHCLRNVMPSYISIMAISIPHILGGTYIVETVFSYPGIGTLAYESARYKDYNLLMLVCILSGVVVIFCNIIGQAINERIDPRIKAEKTGEALEVEVL